MIHLEKISFKKPLEDVMLYYGNFWDIQMALKKQTNFIKILINIFLMVALEIHLFRKN